MFARSRFGEPKREIPLVSYKSRRWPPEAVSDIWYLGRGFYSREHLFDCMRASKNIGHPFIIYTSERKFGRYRLVCDKAFAKHRRGTPVIVTRKTCKTGCSAFISVYQWRIKKVGLHHDHEERKREIEERLQ